MNWLFIDMNSYFASVEQHHRPELRGRPVAVVPVESDYTSVIASSVQAKRCGVKTGTKVGDAKRLCPGIELVLARPKLYVQVHHALLRSVDKCAPIHKVYSIDEWSIRLTGAEQKVEVASELGRKIKRQVLQDFSPYLTCSIGVAPTRLLAKIASDLKKPDGLTVLGVEDLPDRLENFSLDDLCGIGHGMLKRLDAFGLRTVAELWAISKRQAIEVWGSVGGASWWSGFHGIDEPEAASRRRSMSHENVLAPEFRNERDAYGILVRLVCRLGARLRADGYFAQYLRVNLKDVRGGYWSDGIGLPCVQDTPTLLEKFRGLWERRVLGGAPMKVGADVSELSPASQVSPTLFDELERPRRVSMAIDKINQHWGASTIYFGSMHEYRHRMDDKIAFGRIPSETM